MKAREISPLAAFLALFFVFEWYVIEPGHNLTFTFGPTLMIIGSAATLLAGYFVLRAQTPAADMRWLRLVLVALSCLALGFAIAVIAGTTLGLLLVSGLVQENGLASEMGETIFRDGNWYKLFAPILAAPLVPLVRRRLIL